MKKIIIGSLSALTICITQASYIVKVNLGEEVTFYQWADETPLLGPWINTGSVYDCSNWSPSVESMTTGVSFTQTATDCKQDQTQSAQNREVDNVSGVVRNKGDAYTNTQHITANNTRTAIGSLETWNAISADYTVWVNSGSIYNCANWSPATSTVATGQSFTQTATDCKQPQSRNKQEREQESTTLAIRNKGTATTESQDIAASSTRTATGTKIMTECQFNEAAGSYAYNFGSIYEYMYLWNNEYIGGGPSVFNYNGYQYSVSTFVKTEYSTYLQTNYFYICRKPL